MVPREIIKKLNGITGEGYWPRGHVYQRKCVCVCVCLCLSVTRSDVQMETCLARPRGLHWNQISQFYDY